MQHDKIQMAVFASAALCPAGLLVWGAAVGGFWAASGLLWMTVVVFAADRWTSTKTSEASEQGLSLALAFVHFGLLITAVLALGGAHLTLLDKGLLFGGLSLWFGQISNSIAHELIHAPNRRIRRLGEYVYTSLLNGHHVSAHMLVHHVHAATDQDPNSAPPGMGFWRFAARAYVGEFTHGWRAEAKRHKGWAHPYVRYGAGAALTFGIAIFLGAGAWMVALAIYAHLQLLLSDYVQHYGLRRRFDPSGRLEPVGPQHSWNAPNVASCAMMLNAPRHSDHHMRPARAFPGLIVSSDMPTLPRSLPVMAVIALVPPLWCRVMDRRAACVLQRVDATQG